MDCYQIIFDIFMQNLIMINSYILMFLPFWLLEFIVTILVTPKSVLLQLILVQLILVQLIYAKSYTMLISLEMGGGYMNNELLTSGKIVLVMIIMPKYDVN